MPQATINKRSRRVLKLGCVSVLLLLCAGLSTLALTVQSGSLHLIFPGGNVLKVGTDNFVMSNYSFQNGSTYFLDLNGNGVRNILQFHYLSDDKTLELVFHHANNTEMKNYQLLTMPLP
jgi:hypothetical protein